MSEICHVEVKTISRSAGQSACASAAYRSGETITDIRIQKTFNYTRKEGIEHTEIVAPESIEKTNLTRADLWNAAEANENRKDACVAREIVIALPEQLTADERTKLAVEYAQEIANEYRCAVDVAVHAPSKQGDQRNHHAHLLMTTRELQPDGTLGRKTVYELKSSDRVKRGHTRSRSEDLRFVRKLWESTANRALERAGHPERLNADKHVEHPEEHLGPVRTAVERRGLRTDAGDRNRERRALRAELATLNREIEGLERERTRETDRKASEADKTTPEPATPTPAAVSVIEPPVRIPERPGWGKKAWSLVWGGEAVDGKATMEAVNAVVAGTLPPDATNSAGDTVLHLVTRHDVAQNTPRAVRALIEAGCSPDARNTDGHSPRDHAPRIVANAEHDIAREKAQEQARQEAVERAVREAREQAAKRRAQETEKREMAELAQACGLKHITRSQPWSDYRGRVVAIDNHRGLAVITEDGTKGVTFKLDRLAQRPEIGKDAIICAVSTGREKNRVLQGVEMQQYEASRSRGRGGRAG